MEAHVIFGRSRPPKSARLLGAGGKLQKEQGLRDWLPDVSAGGDRTGARWLASGRPGQCLKIVFVGFAKDCGVARWGVRVG